jgi:hypothetical protein
MDAQAGLTEAEGTTAHERVEDPRQRLIGSEVEIRAREGDAGAWAPIGPRMAAAAYLSHAPEAIEKALRLLNDGKSVREVAAATGLSKSKVGRLRSKYSGQSGTPEGHLDRSPPTPEVSQAAVAPRVTARRGFDRVPEINSLWFSDLSEAERTRFVDAVGLWNLLLAAPEDHREAFLDRLRTWTTAQLARKAVATASAPASTGFPELPDFLDRRSRRSTIGASS